MVRRWINKYWDDRFSHASHHDYSWKTGVYTGLNFFTLIEFYVLAQLSQAGVATSKVLKAHEELSKFYNTPYPFAKQDVIERLKTDGLKIYLKHLDQHISLDGSKQLNLDLIREFYKELDFDNNKIASRLWPRGKKSSIVIDPKRAFGHPVIDSHNIYPQTIYQHYQAGEPQHYIATIYGLSEKEVRDAVEYCEAA